MVLGADNPASRPIRRHRMPDRVPMLPSPYPDLQTSTEKLTSFSPEPIGSVVGCGTGRVSYRLRALVCEPESTNRL